jgi:hypothetical protein
MSVSSVTNSLSTAYMVGRTAWNVYNTLKASATLSMQDQAYRPSKWPPSTSETDEELMLRASNISKQVVEDAGSGQAAERIGYFFDAFLKESHTGSVRITDHPVQGGASISDHAYNLPDKLTIEIFVSDVMDVLVKNQFSEYTTKSVSAYEVLRELKEARQPLEINTRLRIYEDMIIENMFITDDYKSRNSLRCSVSFRQIIMASVSTEIVVLKRKQQAVQENKGGDTSSGGPSVLKQGAISVGG